MATLSLGRFRAKKARDNLQEKECFCSSDTKKSALGATTPLKFASVADFKAKTKGFFGIIKITAIIDTWANLGADDGLMLSLLNDTPCVGVIVQKTLARGKPKSSTRSALDNAILTATDILLKFVKAAAVDVCVRLIEKLITWVMNFLGPTSAATNAILKFLNYKVMEFVCGLLADFIVDDLFRKYVAPYINDIFGREIFRENVNELLEYGLSPAEKQEVDACFQQLMAKTDALRSQFAGGQGGLPPLPPSDQSFPEETRTFSASNTQPKQNLENNNVLIYSAVGVAVVGLLISTTVLASSRKMLVIQKRPPRRPRPKSSKQIRRQK